GVLGGDLLEQARKRQKRDNTSRVAENDRRLTTDTEVTVQRHTETHAHYQALIGPGTNINFESRQPGGSAERRVDLLFQLQSSVLFCQSPLTTTAIGGLGNGLDEIMDDNSAANVLQSIQQDIRATVGANNMVTSEMASADTTASTAERGEENVRTRTEGRREGGTPPSTVMNLGEEGGPFAFYFTPFPFIECEMGTGMEA
ncbi:hypothetical protein GQ44DRAFT_715527, partial [Phaeosphaeriaceae sp. PMI808]